MSGTAALATCLVVMLAVNVWVHVGPHRWQPVTGPLLAGLLLVAAGLLILLILVQQLRADPQAQPVANAVLALALSAGGLFSAMAANWIVRRFNAS